jgi:hypothetical protein
MGLRLSVFLAATVIVAGSSSVAAAALPAVLTQHAHEPFATRPASISYTGDATGIVGGTDGTSVRRPGHLRWTRYTQRQGTARGVVWLNDCDPSCAGGRFSALPATVHVFSPAHGRFTRLTLQFTDHGKHVTDRRRIEHMQASDGTSGYWVYAIVSITPPDF